MMKYIAVGVGGIIGALARYGLSTVFVEVAPTRFPLGTWLANIVGSFLLALLTMYIFRMKQVSPIVINGVGTGMIGSFTTFSTFSVETITLLQNGDFLLAFFYVITSVVFGLYMSWVGFRIGMKLYEQRTENEGEI